MMLETLNQIDWENVGRHVYNSRPQAEIPEAIREVLSDDETIREEALNFLFGQGQESLTIWETTPFIIPFMIELLDESSTQDKTAILQRLINSSNLDIYTGGRANLTIHERRIQLCTYDALAIGISIYLRLLSEDNLNIRNLAVTLLGQMSDRTEYLVPKLVKQFDEEDENSTKTELIWAIANLLSFSDTKLYKLHGRYMKWFRELIENHSQMNIRVVAAKASVQAESTFWGNRRLTDKDISAQVPEVLIEAYRNTSDEYEKQTIINVFSNFLDPEPLLRLIEDSDTTSLEAQFLVYYVLSRDFRVVRNFDKYRGLQNSAANKDINIYDDKFRIDESPFGKLLFQSQKKALERVLAIDKLWDIPTNLFSYFFGLPDSREELRALIEKT